MSGDEGDRSTGESCASPAQEDGSSPSIAGAAATSGTSPRRYTLRTALALTYAALTGGVGAALILIVYLYMRFVPLHLTIDFPEPGQAEGPGGLVSEFDVNQVVLHEFANAMLSISAVVLSILVLAAAALGWFVAGRVLRPVVEVAEAARRVSHGVLDVPVAMRGPHDEIRALADSLDRMQEALAASIGAHRRFAANASHELCTPLATVQTLIDVTLSDPGASLEEHREVLAEIRKENSASVETTRALLDLADA